MRVNTPAPAIRILSIVCLFLSGATNSFPQALEIHHNIPFVDTAPVIDGDISAGEWAGAEIVHLVNETHPSQNVPALVDTEVLMLEDGTSFYLAFIAQDPAPEKIRAYFRDRDSAWNDDFVGVVIDTFNDERRAFEFFSNPLGVQMDLTNDDVMRREDASWNAIWDSAGKITGQGYIVEMKIPLNQLRFTGGLDKQTWGIDLLRFYPRDKRHRLSNNTSDYSISCYLCQLNKAQGFSNLEQNLNLQLVPAVTASFSANRPDPLKDKWQKAYSAEGGMDIRWGINQDLYLNATLNPDFSQVEADVAQIDINNTFSLFFPERREFFLDGADYFNTRANLVHTRNISAPDYGAKITGKHNVHTYGLFFANDTTTNFLIPGNQSSRIASLADQQSYNLALRYRLDISRNINLGLIGTDRRADNYSNTVAGLDGNIRIGNSDRVSAQVLTSRSQYPESIRNDFSQPEEAGGNAYLLNYNHDDSRWDWGVQYTDYGDDFRADMGFINRVDFRQVLVQGGHSWRFGPGTGFSRIRISADWDKTWDQSDRKLEEETEISVNADGPLQSFMFLGYGQRQRFYNGNYFDEYFINFFGQMRPLAGMSISLGVNGGDTIDFVNTRLGQALSINPQIEMYLDKHFQMNLRHNFQRMNINGENLYTTNLSDLRLTYQFNIRSFLRIIIQYADTERNQALYNHPVDRRSKDLTTQLLFSYKLNPQTRFFIGYSDTGLQDDALDSIKLTNHTVFTKFSYAWQY
jgi:hypothetical protein